MESMDSKNITLSFLETLSSADLVSLADDYGIDIPDNLSRRFIIGELLEVAEELNQENSSDEIKIVDLSEMKVSGKKASSELDDDENPESADGKKGEIDSESVQEFMKNGVLPLSFNETEISVMLRNPAWAFVYWDISAEALKKLSLSKKFRKLVLRISYFLTCDEEANPVKYFDMDISLNDREQYVLLDTEQKFFRVDLVSYFEEGVTDTLTVSEKFSLPETPLIFEKAVPGEDVKVSEILELSGLKVLLKSHYQKYRQSFVQ